MTVRWTPPPANDDRPRNSAIVGKPSPFDDLTPEERNRRADAADAVFQKMKRKIAEGR